MLTHKCKDGDRPYVCRYCGLKFNVVNRYKKHVTRVHAPKQAKSQYLLTTNISTANYSGVQSDRSISENNCKQDLDVSLEQVSNPVHQVTNSMQLDTDLSFHNGAIGVHQTNTDITSIGQFESTNKSVQN